MKRWRGLGLFAFLLGLLVFSSAAVIPLSAGHAGPVGITDWYGLDAVRENLQGDYYLATDLNEKSPGYGELAGPGANAGEGWLPIGEAGWGNPGYPDVTAGFGGTFDGRGRSIRGLFINRPEETAVGLFAAIAAANQVDTADMDAQLPNGIFEGAVKNITFVGADVTGGVGVGVVAGTSLGEVSGITAAGKVSGEICTGGLVGNNHGTISDSQSSVNVESFLTGGGVVGSNLGEVKRCSATGRVSGFYAAGGLAGANMGIISRSRASGRVGPGGKQPLDSQNNYMSGEFLGGLAGLNTGAIIDSGASGNVSGGQNVGGLVGGAQGYGMLFDLAASLEEADIGDIALARELPFLGVIFGSRASGRVDGISGVGGLVGASSSMLILESYATGRVEGDCCVGGLVGVNGGEGLNGDIIPIFEAGAMDNPYEISIIAECYATGNVRGWEEVGGLVGSNIGYFYRDLSDAGARSPDAPSAQMLYGAVIFDSYARGGVTAGWGGGGLVGYNAGEIWNSFSTGPVSEEHSCPGALNNSCSSVGGLVGYNECGGMVEDSFWDTQTSGTDYSAGGTGLPTEDMKDIATYEEWDIEASSRDMNDGYPFLSWQAGNSPVWYIFRSEVGPRPPRVPSTVPSAPPGFRIRHIDVFPVSIYLQWLESLSEALAGYRLYVSTGGGALSDASGADADKLEFWLLDELDPDVFDYMHSGLTPGIKYYYVITSFDRTGAESQISSRILWAIAGTEETGEMDPVDWDPSRVVARPGSLTVTINPGEVREEARWRRAGTDAWLESGAKETEVPAGNYEVEFSDVAGWITPGAVSVRVEPGAVARASAAYARSDGAPGAVRLIAPAGAQGRLDLTYSWEAAENATWYRLWINRGGVNTWDRWYRAEDLAADGGVLSVYLSGHRPGMDYRWWVQSWGPDGYGSWSAPMDFNTREGRLLEWPAVPGATWYEIYIMKDGAFFHRQWVQGAVSWSGALPAGTYAWWVQPWGPETGYGGWIPRGEFSVE